MARGCHGGCVDDEGKPAINADTPYATDTCPRRHLLRNPDLTRLLDLYNQTEGKVGFAGDSVVSPQTLDAFDIIADAVAARLREDVHD